MPAVLAVCGPTIAPLLTDESICERIIGAAAAAVSNDGDGVGGTVVASSATLALVQAALQAIASAVRPTNTDAPVH